MARQVIVTLTTEHTEVIDVAENLKLEPLVLDAEGEFVCIPTLNGGEYVFRKAHILSMVKGAKGERKTA